MIRRETLLAVLTALLALAGAPASAQDTGPQITFEQTEADLGMISDTRSYRTTFRFTNTGTEPLLIEQLKSGCKCITPTIPRPRYAPGESGVIDVAMDPTGRTTSSSKAFMVFTNAAERPQRLMIKYKLRPLLKLTYGAVDLGVVPLGQVHRRRIDATYTDPQLRIASVEVNRPNIHARMLGQGTDGPSEDGVYSAAIELEVDADMPWGSLHGVELTVNVLGTPADAREPIEYAYSKTIEGNVYGHVRATALTYRGRMTPRSIIEVGPMSPGQGFQQSVRLEHDAGARFALSNPRPVEVQGVPPLPLLSARMQPAGPGGHQVDVSGHAPQELGPFVGYLLVDTDLPDESPLRILVIGEVVEGKIPTQESGFRDLRKLR